MYDERLKAVNSKTLLLSLFVFFGNGYFLYSMEQKKVVPPHAVKGIFSDDAVTRINIFEQIGPDDYGNLVYRRNFTDTFDFRMGHDGRIRYHSDLAYSDATIDCSVLINELSHIIAGKFYCQGYNDAMDTNFIDSTDYSFHNPYKYYPLLLLSALGGFTLGTASIGLLWWLKSR